MGANAEDRKLKLTVDANRQGSIKTTWKRNKGCTHVSVRLSVFRPENDICVCSNILEFKQFIFTGFVFCFFFFFWHTHLEQNYNHLTDPNKTRQKQTHNSKKQQQNIKCCMQRCGDGGGGCCCFSQCPGQARCTHKTRMHRPALARPRASIPLC